MGSATPGGTDPLSGESEEEYVARQRKLQAEVGATINTPDAIMCLTTLVPYIRRLKKGYAQSLVVQMVCRQMVLWRVSDRTPGTSPAAAEAEARLM